MSHKSEPLISVIIATYNGRKTLQQCLDSVTKQTYKNIELIVIDGGSSDGTMDLLLENSQLITYWVSEPDRGIYNAWNKALIQSKGDWIFFIGGDDFLWCERVLEHMAARLVLVPAAISVVYGKIMLIDKITGVEIYLVGDPWQKVKERFKQVMCIPHPAVMHRRSLFKKHGNFDESFYIAGDYEFLLRELKTNDAFFIKDIVLTAMRQGGVSTNPANTLLSLREVRSAQRKNGQRWPQWIWFMALVRAYTRLMLWSLLGEKAARIILDVGRWILGLPSFWTKT